MVASAIAKLLQGGIEFLTTYPPVVELAFHIILNKKESSVFFLGAEIILILTGKYH